jgi:hypothetical protein
MVERVISPSLLALLVLHSGTASKRIEEGDRSRVLTRLLLLQGASSSSAHMGCS